MRRYLFIFPVLCAVALFSGCQSKVLQMLFEPQEYYNYAVTEGVTCTAPEMIDGDEKTRGYAAGRWIHLNLPTQKAIHRITIRGTNITSFMIYEKLEGEGRWHPIQQVQNNESPVVQMRVSGVVTDALRIYISGTTEDEKMRGEFDPMHGRVVSRVRLGRAFVHEIEVYGLVSKEGSPEGHTNETLDF